MQEDFHYYATYCAAYIAGYTHKECLEICYSAQFVDCCSETLLASVKGPKAAATTQLQMELMDARIDPVSLQNITRIWASFHFLPYDLYSQLPHRPRVYMNKYRLICKPNGDLVVDTLKLAKDKNLQAVGVAMHVLADTWAHSYFAGTPARVINNTVNYFYEIIENNAEKTERKIKFNHNPASPDEIDKSYYTNSVQQENENSVMNLGHGRAGHLPDYSFIKYRYLPAWGDYTEIVKDNPSDYYKAFAQMVYAMKYLRGIHTVFEKSTYATDELKPFEREIREILAKRQLNASNDWKAFGESLSGETIPEFDISKYKEEYIQADEDNKDVTFLGRFFMAAMAQKSMVTNKIFKSGNLLAGFSVDYSIKGFKGIDDFKKLLGYMQGVKRE